jgi:phosphate transport system protein
MELQQEFETELHLLRERVLFLGAEVEQALTDAALGFANRDPAMCRSVLEHNIAIKEIERHADEQCIRILATPQASAANLRIVLSLAKATSLLERIADRASTIARVAINIGERDAGYAVLPDLRLMANQTITFLRSALMAVTETDFRAALEIKHNATAVEESFNHIFHTLILLIVTEPTNAIIYSQQLEIARSIRRIGNYVVDMCELIP